MHPFARVRGFAVELDRQAGGGTVYRGGEALSGQVVVDVAKAVKVRALAVCARGLATAHWLEGKSIGMNTIYSDYTAFQTYLRRKQHLIPEILQGISETMFAQRHSNAEPAW